MGSLSGKVAIVTGGGQGIGRAEALLLAEEGAAVIVNDMGGLVDGKATPQSEANRVVAEIEQAGGQAAANFADVSDWQAADAMVQQAYDTFGRLDILLCNAGILRDRMVHTMSEEEWDAVIKVHLKGHFAPTRHALARWRELAKQSGQPVNGRIIYTTSEAGMYGHPGQANYSAAKAGILGLCFEVAKEAQRFGVTVNTISPRGRTQMTEGAFGSISTPEGTFDAWAPENVAPMAAFLSRDEARDISGQIFVVYGGTVQLMQPWAIAGKLDQDARWSSDQLLKEVERIIPGLRAQAPTFPDIGIPA